MLFFHLHPGLLGGLFPSVFPTKSLYAFLINPVRATCPAYLIFLDLITQIHFCEEYNYETVLCAVVFYSRLTDAI